MKYVIFALPPRGSGGGSHARQCASGCGRSSPGPTEGPRPHGGGGGPHGAGVGAIAKIGYFNMKTMYSNRKFDIDLNKLMI